MSPRKDVSVLIQVETSDGSLNQLLDGVEILVVYMNLGMF